MRCRGLILGLILCGMAVAAAAQGVDEVLTESFDDVLAPALPPGWEVTEGAWETSTSVPSPGSGGNNLYARGSAAGTLTLPPVNLAGAMSAGLTYLARRTGTYDPANVRISASIDGGGSYPIEVAAAGTTLPEDDGSYETVVLPLPAALLDHADVRLRIETFGLSTSGANVRLDDLRVTATRLVIVQPAALRFAAIPGGSQTQTVEITNTDAAPLQVNAPFVGGGAFSVMPSTAVLIPPGETRGYAVTWSPVVQGAEARTLLFVHEHGTSSVELAGETVGGIFGFMADSSTVVHSAAVHEVPTRLIFADPAGLQGLQFSLAWEDSLLQLVDVRRGAALIDSTAWTLSYHVDSLGATVVLLGSGTTTLSSGTLDSLLTLRFAVSDSDTESDAAYVTLSNVVGALGLPGGDDARLTVAPDSHVVSLRPGEAGFSVNPSQLSLPQALVGDSSEAMVSITNPGGTVPLVVDSLVADNPLFRLVPDTVVVPPEGTVVLAVRFSPTAARFGAQQGTIVFYHNGMSGSDTLHVSAVGLGGRGDVAIDGIVDAVDLVQALDFVLLRSLPDSLQRVSGDLHPFPEGDGMLDVRDLTVLSHAIVNGFWPDSVSIPALEPGNVAMQSLLATSADPDGDTFALDETWTLALETDVPVRALQVVLAAEDVARVRSVGENGAAPVVTMFTRNNNEIRVLSYRTDGGMLDAGTHELLKVEPEEEGGRIRPLYVIGVDEDLKRVPVTVAGVGGKDAESEVPGDVLRLGVPYPNPVQFLEGKRLRLPLVGRPSDGRGRAAVFNILGQRVRQLNVADESDPELEWDGLNQRGGLVSPGIYFIRLEDSPGTVRSVIVVR